MSGKLCNQTSNRNRKNEKCKASQASTTSTLSRMHVQYPSITNHPHLCYILGDLFTQPRDGFQSRPSNSWSTYSPRCFHFSPIVVFKCFSWTTPLRSGTLQNRSCMKKSSNLQTKTGDTGGIKIYQKHSNKSHSNFSPDQTSARLEAILICD